MNKKQLIGKYKNLEGVWDAEGAELARRIFLQDLEQLDEPQKPVVPQFVADWYEENKDDFETNLFCCVHKILRKRNNDLSEFEDWVIDENTEPFKTLVNMHQFDYEVEKEKRYLVKIKGVSKFHSCLVFGKITNEWKITSTNNDNELIRDTHTRKELEEEGFGEVFNSPLFEVEEVEE